MKKDDGVVLLIDFENVHNYGLEGTRFLSEKDTIIFFLSEPSACTTKRETLEAIAASGTKMIYRKLVNKGKNGLDFYIASEIGYLKGAQESRPMVIISNDNGYSAVIDYWKTQGTANAVFLKNNIEDGLKTALPNDTERYALLSKETGTVNICNFINAENNKNKQKEAADAAAKALEKERQDKEAAEVATIANMFANTEYTDLTEDIHVIIRDTTNRGSIYNNLLHKFGRENGLNIYRIIKAANYIK